MDSREIFVESLLQYPIQADLASAAWYENPKLCGKIGNSTLQPMQPTQPLEVKGKNWKEKIIWQEKANLGVSDEVGGI